jgi:hypothetical protein
MKRLYHCLLFATLALSLVGSVKGSAFDFTPTEIRTLEDGMPMKRFAFHSGESTIFFRPPKAWTMFGGGEQLTFTPPAPLEGEVRLGISPLDSSILFDEPGLVVYRATVRKNLPVQAQNVEVISETPDAFPLDDWKSFEITVSYNLGGKKKMRSVLFVTMSQNRQVRLVADGNEPQFEQVHTAARTLLGSWFEPPFGWPGYAPIKTP